MKTLSKKQEKQALFNILSTVLTSGISFFTIPIFTRLLGAAEYGKYSIFISWAGILTCFFGLMNHGSIGTGIYTFKEKYYEFRSSIICMGTMVSIFLIGVGLCFSRFFSQFLNYSVPIFIILLFTSFFNYIINFTNSAMIYEKKAGINLLIAVSLSLSTVLLSVFILKYIHPSELYLSRVYGHFIPYAVIALIALFCMFFKKPYGFSKEYWLYAFKIGSPLIFNSLAQNILGQSDRIMMQRFGISEADIGIYSFFYTFTSILSTVLMALNNAWCPTYFDDLDNRSTTINRKCNNYIELFSLITCGFLMVCREVGLFFVESEYYSGFNILPIFVISIFFTFMYQFPVNFEFFVKKTTIITIGTFIASIINILLNYLLIPDYGMYGAAIATALSYGMLFVLHFFIAKRIKDSVSFHIRLIQILPWFILVALFIVLYYIFDNLWIVRWILAFFIGIFIIVKIIKRQSIFGNGNL